MTLEEAIRDMRNHTDLWPWYWLSYGANAFATVEAFPANEGDPFPEPRTELRSDMEDERLWIGENGTKMIINDRIAGIERQNGDTICRFLAMAHARLVKPAQLLESIPATARGRRPPSTTSGFGKLWSKSPCAILRQNRYWSRRARK